MSLAEPHNECTIVLGDAPAVDTFGLSLVMDGEEALETIAAAGPGIFRTRRHQDEPPFADSGVQLLTGMIAGFLQQGPLLLPVRMPEDGWLAALAPDGATVEHGTPIIRYIRANGGIAP